MSEEDKIFQKTEQTEDFSFNKEVAQVFDNMVSRSVPYYSETQQMQTELLKDFLPEQKGVVCDLGCSTGTTIDLIIKNNNCPDSVKFFGYDNSEPMLDKARNKLADGINSKRITLYNSDLSALPELPSCDVVIMNWTLQFVRPMERENLIKNVFSSLKSGGVLFLSEKVLGSSSKLNRFLIDHYLQYKTAQGGYTDGENQRKREALENVLVPYRLNENYMLLNRCGFKQVDTYFRWLNFASIIAIKD